MSLGRRYQNAKQELLLFPEQEVAMLPMAVEESSERQVESAQGVATVWMERVVSKKEQEASFKPNESPEEQ